MKVTLVGVTVAVNLDAFDDEWSQDIISTDAQYLMEGAGRLCYGSWRRPNPLTATNKGYLGNIITQGHLSVLEHGVASFLITGVSRTLTHELIRHRHFSYSELSQRFVNMVTCEFVMPPLLQSEGGRSTDLDEVMYDVGTEARHHYESVAGKLTEWGYPRKQAREAARAVLPGMTETKIVMTGNVRAWRHMLYMRGSIHADREIRELAVEVARELKALWPNTFQDMSFGDVDGFVVIDFDNPIMEDN